MSTPQRGRPPTHSSTSRSALRSPPITAVLASLGTKGNRACERDGGADIYADAVAAAPRIYEPYLYDLSPTWDAWCFLRASEIHKLDRYHNMGDHSAYFWGNLPIRWARVAGMVIAVDDFFGGRRVFTIDDSSGATIECVAKADSDGGAGIQGCGRGDKARTSNEAAKLFPEITLGAVVEAKGRLVVFHDRRQISIVIMRAVRGTAHELVLMGKRAKFQREVLSQTWVADEMKARRRLRRKIEKRERARRAMGAKPNPNPNPISNPIPNPSVRLGGDPVLLLRKTVEGERQG